MTDVGLMQISLTVKDGNGKKIFESKGGDQAAHDAAYQSYISSSRAPQGFRDALQQAQADQAAQEQSDAMTYSQAGL